MYIGKAMLQHYREQYIIYNPDNRLPTKPICKTFVQRRPNVFDVGQPSAALAQQESNTGWTVAYYNIRWHNRLCIYSICSYYNFWKSVIYNSLKILVIPVLY